MVPRYKALDLVVKSTLKEITIWLIHLLFIYTYHTDIDTMNDKKYVSLVYYLFVGKSLINEWSIKAYVLYTS